MARKRISLVWRLPDALWERMAPLLPRYQVSCQGGRPRFADAADRQRYFLRFAYWLPVESGTKGIWFRQHAA